LAGLAAILRRPVIVERHTLMLRAMLMSAVCVDGRDKPGHDDTLWIDHTLDTSSLGLTGRSSNPRP
jgi:hypothetical protein